MAAILKTVPVLLFLLIFFHPSFQYAQDSRSFSEFGDKLKADKEKTINDGLNKAYLCLISLGTCADKTNSIQFLENNYTHERTLFIVLALLDHTYAYNNPDYKDGNETMHQGDVLAERLVKILGRIGDPKCFPTLLNIVVHPERHRDATVKSAYESMAMLKWQK